MAAQNWGVLGGRPALGRSVKRQSFSKARSAGRRVQPIGKGK